MRRCSPCCLGLLAHEEGLDVGAAGQRGAGRRRRRPSSGRRPRSRPTRAPARRRARPARRSRRAAGSRAWRRRSTARSAPLVSTTSPMTSAWLRSSSIRRWRASMRRVPYRACSRASCGRSRSSRARSCCSASRCSRSTRRATRRSRPAAAIAGLEATRASDPSAGEERARERAHSRAREVVDDADDVLVAPFAGGRERLEQLVGRAAACPTLLGAASSTASGCRSWPASPGDGLDRRRRAGASASARRPTSPSASRRS